MAEPQHVPVLLEASLEYLNVRAGGVIVDATLGLGGHSAAIARRLGSSGRLICFDRDESAMAKAKARLAALAEELGSAMPAVEFVPRPFSELAEAVQPGTLDGLLADFGVSSMQLDEAHRGFSFRADGPLDMRMDPRRRGKEVAENRQSHCAGAADIDDSGTCSNRIGLRPTNEGR
jgi:16S rRNA (cytosine1402-N4)-methyltransferase